jgi:hypothetical protein
VEPASRDRLLASLHPGRPDLAPTYTQLVRPGREGVDASGEIKSATERRSVAAVLHLFISLVLEVIQHQMKSADGPLAASFDLALLPVRDCLTADHLRTGSLSAGCVIDADSDNKLTAKSVLTNSVREVRLSCGYAHVLVKRSRGPPLAWGANNFGCTGLQPSNAASHPPGPLAALVGIRVVQVKVCIYKVGARDSGVGTRNKFYLVWHLCTNHGAHFFT